jgi:hypothetical protein
MKRFTSTFLCFCLAIIGAVLIGCTKTEPPIAPEALTSQGSQQTEVKVESPQSATNQSTRNDTAKLPLPKLTEVREALNRTYGKVVALDDSRKQNFVVGDFNGDGAQDIAMIVKPVEGMLPEINSEVANWTILDPLKLSATDLEKGLNKLPAKPMRVFVRQSEELLAVIHGYGPQGWRSAETTQAFLLKHAVGSAMQSHPKKEVLSATKIVGTLPKQDFDVISATIEKESGFLFWTGAKYAWYYQTKDEGAGA